MSRYPSNDTGIYLHTHKHSWRESGTHSWPNGEDSVVFTCRVCGDVIAAGHVHYDEPKP